MAKSFVHKEIEVKKKIFELAKELSKKDDFSSKLSGAILFINLADYLALSVYDLLKRLVEDSTKKYYLGDIGLKLKPRKKVLTLGEIAEELKQFDFPEKEEVLILISNINSSRKLVVHHIVKTPYDKLPTIDQAIEEICSYTEKLVDLVDKIFNDDIPKITTLLDVKTDRSL